MLSQIGCEKIVHALSRAAEVKRSQVDSLLRRFDCADYAN
jgi:hypothetical protein